MTEKVRVAAEAKIISESLEQAGTPAPAIARALKASFQQRYRWIKDFVAEPVGALAHMIYMIASKIPVDRVELQVPYKNGAKRLSVEPDGSILLDGKKLSQTKLKEAYKQLGLTHAMRGHGPSKNITDVANEALTNKPSFASGRFTADSNILRAFAEARDEFLNTGQRIVYVAADPSAGRAFVKLANVPPGANIIDNAPFPSIPDVVELEVKRIRAVFGSDGSITSIYPIGF